MTVHASVTVASDETLTSCTQGDAKMNAIESIMNRKSVRAYKPEQIDGDTLQTILHAGMAAPVASGAYDTLHITVVQDQNLFSAIDAGVSELLFTMLGKKIDKTFGAPTMVFISSKAAKIPGLEYANAACVLENMAIAATGLGVGSIIWGGAAMAVAQSARLTERLEIPEGYKPILCISLGYAKEEEPPKKHQIKMNEVISIKTDAAPNLKQGV